MPRPRPDPASGIRTAGPLPDTGRARMPDVARLAGVSTATVDRVLNQRGQVRPATAQRVVRAATELAYLPDDALRATLAPEPMRLVFVLPQGTNRYLRMLGDTVGFARDQWLPFNVQCRVALIEGFDPDLLARSLLRLGAQCDGIAFMALEHPVVREAVDRLHQRGVPVVTLISDLSHSRRAAYVGLDNRAAGRTAAWLIGRLIGRAAKVAMIAGSLSYRAHEEREMGFLGLFRERFPAIAVVGLREGRDDEARNFEQTRELLREHPDLAGIYNIGGGADGVARAMKACGREHDLVLVAHGLTPDTRALLIDGTIDAVLTQTPQSVILNCIRIFANLRERRDALAGVEPNRISIVLRENLP